MKMPFKKISFIATLVMATVAAAMIVVPPTNTEAAVLDSFNPEYIISDSKFIDNKSMSSSDIQNFLTSKNSVCLKDKKVLGLYDQDGNGLGDEPYGKGKNVKVSVATLIKQAADLYDISPKVILATLQKEQGLITNTECPQWKYNTALGYGCPDSAPCDDSAYGLTRQIDYGVWHFKGFFNDTYPVPPTVPGSKKIAYNPDDRCGGKTINIRNRATAALYSYTPYQPNTYALNGGSDSSYPKCGAFGNRNFFSYYTIWFGPPNTGADAFLAQCSDGKYIIESASSRRRAISAATATEWGLSDSDFVEMDYGCGMPAYDLPMGQLTRSRNTGDAYFVHKGDAYYVPNQKVADAWGLGSIGVLPQIEGSNLHTLVNKIDKTGLTTVATSDNTERSTHYLILNGKRHAIHGTPSGDNSVRRMITGDTVLPSRTLPVSLFQTIPSENTVNYAFVVDGSTYVFDHGKVRKVVSDETTSLVSSTTTPLELPPKILDYYSNTGTLGDSFSRPDMYYKVNLGHTITQTSSKAVVVNIASSSPELITNLLATRLLGEAKQIDTLSQLHGNIRLIECGGSNYIIERNIRAKRSITDGAVAEWGFINKHFFTKDRGCAYPTYATDLDRLIRSRNTGKVYYVADQKAYYVHSAAAAQDWGFGEVANNVYPQFDPDSIHDNLEVIRELPPAPENLTPPSENPQGDLPPIEGNIRLISCDGVDYLVERFIPTKRLLTQAAITNWGFDKYAFVDNDQGCSYPTYTTELAEVIRSRTTNKVYYVHEQKAYWVYNQAIADKLGLGNYSIGVYPQFEGKSINDFLEVVTTEASNIPVN